MRSKLLLNNNLLFLLTILQCIENIKIYVAGYKTHDDFLWGNDRRDFNASLMQLIAIGWDTIKNHLEPLKSVCVELVYELGFDKEKLRKELQSPYYKHIQYLLN